MLMHVRASRDLRAARLVCQAWNEQILQNAHHINASALVLDERDAHAFLTMQFPDLRSISLRQVESVYLLGDFDQLTSVVIR